MEATGLDKDKSKVLKYRDILPGVVRMLPRLPATFKALKESQALTADPDAEVSIGTHLEANAAKYPDSPALLYEDVSYTHREFNEMINKYANYLLSLGVKKGDVIIAFLENRPEILFIIGAVSKIGAIASLINPHQRGPVLLHSLKLTPARLFIIGEELLDAFEEIRDDPEFGREDGLYFLPDQGLVSAPQGYLDWSGETMNADPGNPPTTPTIRQGDQFAYLFTSGTTGMPKAVITNHNRWTATMMAFGKMMFNLSPKDTMYIPLPFYHGTALYVGWPTASAGGAAVAIRRRFSASNFWKDVDKFNATAFTYIGELCRYIMQQPTTSEDSKNTIKKIVGNGLRPEIWKEFKTRFGIREVFEFYGATEGNIAFGNLLNLDCTVGICVTPYAIVKYDTDNDEPIRDENGFLQRVEKGEAGLLIGHISDKAPFVGYSDKQATEKKIIRDGFEKGDAWFDTGDLLRDIGFKHAQFVDRLGDTFRWKGENVSTTEVEAIINSHEQVLESNVFGVAIPGTDGRAGMAAIITDKDVAEFNLAGLYNVLSEGLPTYAVPHFVRFKTEFDTTDTLKLKKLELKKQAYDPSQFPDPIFTRLPGGNAFTPLTAELYQEIVDGKHRF